MHALLFLHSSELTKPISPLCERLDHSISNHRIVSTSNNNNNMWLTSSCEWVLCILWSPPKKVHARSL